MARKVYLCTLCNSGQIGDEFHFILDCKSLENLRKNYLCKYYYQNPNIIKFNELMSILTKRKCWKNFAFLLLIYMMLSLFLILNPLSTLLSLLMYALSNTHIYLYMYLWPVCTNVNNCYFCTSCTNLLVWENNKVEDILGISSAKI